MNITERILYLIPGAKFFCRENDYDQIVWSIENLGPKPLLSDLVDVTELELQLALKQSTATRECGKRELTAIVLWICQKIAIPPATAKDEIIAIWKGLP